MNDSLPANYIKLGSLTEIQERITIIKEQGVDWLTNFYVDDGRLEHWTRKGQAYYCATEQSLLFLRQRQGFWQLYLTTSNVQDLSGCLRSLTSCADDIFVTDILGEAPAMRETLLANKWQPYLALQRIVKLNPPGQAATPVADEFYARPGEEQQIMDMLAEDIDPFGEQVPDLDEIAERIAAREELVIRDKATSELKAFFSFIRQGSTVTGRFLVTRRKYREEGWGVDLSDMYFALHADARRILGWVREDKKRNLKLYELQGYRKDRLRDEVFIFKGADACNG